MAKFILTEEEKNRILGLHKTKINEERNMINEVDLKQIQQLLIQKLGPDALGPRKDDGKLGTFTLNAIYSALTQTQGGATTPGAQTTPATQTIKVGMTAKGDLQDQAEGMVLKVAKVTPITECGLTEIEFTDAKYTRYGYFKGEYNRNDGIKKFGEGVKSTNPCTEFTSMGNFGSLQFS